MSRKGAPAWTPWTTAEEVLLRRLYPHEGIGACVPVMPNRTEHAIRPRVATLGLKLAPATKFEIMSAAHWSQRGPLPKKEHRERFVPGPLIDDVVDTWTRRRAGGAA